MKYVMQSLNSGSPFVIDAPIPKVGKNEILIETQKTLISAGTEKMLINFAQSNIINKILKNKSKVSKVINKVKNDGIFEAYESVNNKLKIPIGMGYCNIGIVKDLGENVQGFSINDKVISNGGHSEYIAVSEKLCCKIDPTIDDDDAIFSILASISLHGIRLSNPTMGEKYCVIGLGLIGVITSLLLNANGCKVIAIDLNSNKVKKAKDLGINAIDSSAVKDPKQLCLSFSDDIGLDAAILCIDSNNSEALQLSSEILRKRGRIVLIGNSKINLSRDIFYEKELSFSVSRSYGPGRYEEKYEKDSLDYPIDYVRWTENRNIQTIVDLIKDNKINFKNLISKSFAFIQFKEAYEYVLKNNDGLGVILDYEKNTKPISNLIEINKPFFTNYTNSLITIGLIGAGSYANKILPLFKRQNIRFKTIISKKGLSAAILGKKFAFENVSTSDDDIFNDKEINLVIICTHHDSHAYYVAKSIQNNKNVYVEKPLAINMLDLDYVKNMILKNPINLLVGYNRRFSKHIKKVKKILEINAGLKNLIININSGKIDSNHWVNNPNIGGGKLISEFCHFLDLSNYLIGKKVISFNKICQQDNSKNNFSVQLKYEDGSISIINYFSNGNLSFPKEELNVFFNGKVIRINNYKKTQFFGFGLFKSLKTFRQDKGQKEMINVFLNSLQNYKINPVISFKEIYEMNKLLIEIDKN